MKIAVGILLGILLAVGIVGCSTRKSQLNTPQKVEERFVLDDKTAEAEFDAYIESKKLSDYTPPTESKSSRYDFTGDGTDELYRCIAFGGSVYRVGFAVYDPVEKKGYFLDSYNSSYRVDHIDADGPVVIESDAFGNSVEGRIVIEAGGIAFEEKKDKK